MKRIVQTRRLLLALLAFSTLPIRPWCETPPRSDNILFGLPGGLKATAPRLFSKSNLFILAGGSCLTAAVWNTPKERTYDDRLERVAKNETVFNFGNLWGNGLTQGALAVGTWSAGRMFHSPKLQGFGFDSAVALVGSGVAAWAIKYPVNRTRPNGASFSFPSGHTTSAFSIVPAAWKYFGWKAGVPAILAGICTGLGRMEDHKHYLSDVTAGAALGLLVGTAACGVGGTWVPKPESTPKGLSFLWKFQY